MEKAHFDPNSRRNRLDATFEAKANYVYGSRSHKTLMDDLANLARQSGATAADAELYEAVLRGVSDVEPDIGKIRFTFDTAQDVGFGAVGTLSGLDGFGPVRLDLSKHGAECAVEDDPGKRDYWNHTVIRGRDGETYSVALAHGEPGSDRLSDLTVLDEVVSSMDAAAPWAQAMSAQYQVEARAEPEAGTEHAGPEGSGLER